MILVSIFFILIFGDVLGSYSDIYYEEHKLKIERINESGEILTFGHNQSEGERVFYKLKFSSQEIIINITKCKAIPETRGPLINSKNRYVGIVKNRIETKVLLNINDKLIGSIEDENVYYSFEYSNTIRLIKKTVMRGNNINESSNINYFGGNIDKRKEREKREIDESTTFGVNLFLVIEYGIYNFLNKSKRKVHELLVTLISQANRFFRHPSFGLDFHVKLSDYHIITNEESNTWIVESSSRLLENLKKWLKERPRSKAHDLTYVLSSKDLHTTTINSVGIATISQVCTSDGLGIIKLKGYSSSHTIAHEIGHSLGILHDSSSNCQGDSWKTSGYTEHPVSHHRGKRIYYMMNSVRYLATYRGWSLCSRNTMSLSVKQRSKRCLIKPSNFAIKVTGLPGEKTDLDNQCSTFNILKMKFDIRDTLEECTYLRCVGSRFIRTATSIAWLDGTPCGRRKNKWCISGKCVKKEEEEDGEWLQWSEWTQCSRSCGMGIRRKNRICSIKNSGLAYGRYCLGDSDALETCSHTPCSTTQMHHRTQQCNRINRNNRGKEIIVTRDSCKMYCNPDKTNSKKYKYFSDGTSCKARSNNICIKGKCTEVGCDYVIGSGVQNDKCGVCGGNADTCRRVQKVIEGVAKPPVRQTVIGTIPAGSSMVELKLLHPNPGSIIGIRYLNQTDIWNNGHTRYRTHTFDVDDGSSLFYSGFRSPVQIITWDKPIRSVMQFYIQFDEDRNIDFSMQVTYTTKSSQKKTYPNRNRNYDYHNRRPTTRNNDNRRPSTRNNHDRRPTPPEYFKRRPSKPPEYSKRRSSTPEYFNRRPTPSEYSNRRPSTPEYFNRRPSMSEYSNRQHSTPEYFNRRPHIKDNNDIIPTNKKRNSNITSTGYKNRISNKGTNKKYELNRQSFIGSLWSQCKNDCSGNTTKTTRCISLKTRKLVFNCRGKSYNKIRSCKDICQLKWVPDCTQNSCGGDTQPSPVIRCYKIDGQASSYVKDSYCEHIKEKTIDKTCNETCVMYSGVSSFKLRSFDLCFLLSLVIVNIFMI